MSTHRHFDKICCVILALTLIITVLFINAEHFGINKASTVPGYEKTLFDTSEVHSIDIVMDDWDEFISNCTSEEYYSCTVVIDNEAYKNVAIRGKGNTSPTQVKSYGNNRYSFKIEFDHFDSSKNYYGLDKLCLNNIIQDNTYMKDYLCYQMMDELGVASPLCSYVYITVNGEDWGLYLAVEGVEESFLQRNYGKNYGELYKPDSMNMGGGRGNGENFNADDFFGDSNLDSITNQNEKSNSQTQNNTAIPQRPNASDNGNADNKSTDNNDEKALPGGMPKKDSGAKSGGMTNSSDDVLLKYIDDEFDSYSNIFNNAKTDITDADKARLISSIKKLNNGEDLDSVVDIDSVIRYFAVHNFVLNFDSYTGSMIHNYYFYEEDGQLKMIPWDYNLAFGGFRSTDSTSSLVNYPIDSPVSGGNVSDRPMISWIFENEEYTELYHKYLSEFISSYFDSGYFSEMIDSVNSMISPYVEKDPTKFCTYEEFEKGISTLKEFCLLRAESISKQLNGTIGSTSDTQENDTFVDAEDLQITDMGSMNNATSGGKDNSDIKKTQTQTEDNLEEDNSSENSSSADNNSFEEKTTSENLDGEQFSDVPPDFLNDENEQKSGSDVNQNKSPDDAELPNRDNQSQQQEQNGLSVSSWILIGLSLSVLALGLVFAFSFKRRK